MRCYKKVIQKIGIDKVAHFALSAFLCLAAGRFVPVWAAIAIAVVFGIGKELYDSGTGGKWDWKDILADAAGTVTATILLLI